jgi:hypothetical protein
MKCEEVQSALTELYVDGEDDPGNTPDPALRDEIALHLLSCEKCAQDAKELKGLLQLMEDSPAAIPGPALRENFSYMLRSESDKLAAAGLLKEAPRVSVLSKRREVSMREVSSWWKIAAVFLVLAIGIWIGAKLPVSLSHRPTAGTGDSSARGEIMGLKNEVRDMKEALLFTLLKDESASQRIRAVSYSEEISNPNQSIINALTATLNHDKNVNVRLASLYSLARFAGDASVRDSLVRSLSLQTEPIVQIILINLLTEMKEVKAIKPIRDIISNEKTLKDVKTIAEKGLRTL